MNPNDFKEVSKEVFFETLKGSDYNWAKGIPKDVSWWEAHAQFVIDTKEKTVGYLRTSSWNPDTEYYLITELCE